MIFIFFGKFCSTSKSQENTIKKILETPSTSEISNNSIIIFSPLGCSYHNSASILSSSSKWCHTGVISISSYLSPIQRFSSSSSRALTWWWSQQASMGCQTEDLGARPPPKYILSSLFRETSIIAKHRIKKCHRALKMAYFHTYLTKYLSV